MLKKLCILSLALCLLVGAAPALAADAFAPFAAENLNGEGDITEDYFAQAQITLVNYWATWCPPCREELPDLAQVADLSGGRVQVLGVMLDAMDQRGERSEEAIDTMKTLLTDAEATYAVAFPAEGTLLDMASEAVYIPTTFVVNEKGEILDTVVGAKSAQDWISLAESYIDDPNG